MLKVKIIPRNLFIKGVKMVEIENIVTTRSIISRRYDYLRLRLIFLGLEVDVELLELIAGSGMWIIFCDFLNLYFTHQTNNIYDMVFKLRPLPYWMITAGVLGFIHLIAVLLDRSYLLEQRTPDGRNRKPIPENEVPTLVYLRIRQVCMFLAFWYLSAITLSIWSAHSYALVWKYGLRDAGSAFYCHIRLRSQCRRLKKRNQSNTE